ncbi:FUSC family protein [Actinomadura hibisca]|uniref:FUSC family protein n=1 Tax=Actinomadura hibisca TaxID=68565 RepID=UPI000830ABB3|nr:FUSC family protein [Actinomadura hibisca]
MLQRAREAYARIDGRAAPFYGLASALALAVPLVAGALTGRAAQGAMIALGAYLVALRAPEGPYGARARNLAGAVLVVTVGATVGGHLAGHAWLTVLVVPPIVALGSMISWIGPTAALAVLMTAVRPATDDVVYNGFLELLGGLWVSVLLLAPWPARRMRPLQAALAEAAEAVAEALDAVAESTTASDDDAVRALEVDDPDLATVARQPYWSERRRAAARALGAARGTVGFYRPPGGDEPSRPERFVDALARIMHETVALQSLIEAARRHPPRREWEMEAHVAVSALAARLRLLAGAVATAGETPLGDLESAAVRRLARQSEKIRRAGLAGDEDLVAAALIGQIRRSLDRVTAGVDGARRIVAGGLRIGVGPPRPLPGVHPLSAWARMGRAVRTRSPGFRQVGRVGLAVAVAMSLSAALKLAHGHWMTITVMQSLRGTYGETMTRLAQRVGGTAAGSAIAAVLLALAPGQVTAALILFAFALAGFALRPVNFAYWALFGTPLAMMLLDFSAPSDWTAAGERILLTLAGCVLVFLAVRLLWPTGHAERLPLQLGRLLSAHADLTRATSRLVEGELDRLPFDTTSAAEDATDSVAATRKRLGEERVPDAARIAELRAIVRGAHRVRDHLIAIGRLSREEEVDAGPIPEILDRLADRLEEAAAELEDTDPPQGEAAPSPAERLEEEFADLDRHLAGLARRRRAEVKAGVGTDEFTPLRHALLQVAGTRHAVRALRRDTDELIGASVKAARPETGV